MRWSMFGLGLAEGSRAVAGVSWRVQIGRSIGVLKGALSDRV